MKPARKAERRSASWNLLTCATAMGVVGVGLALLWFFTPDDGSLRGHVTDSPDGSTYLAIEVASDACRLFVDREPWPRAIGVPGSIEPGPHRIDCIALGDYDPASAIGFDVPPGVVFWFDYWGP